MNVSGKMWLRAALVAAVGVGLGLGVGHAAAGDQGRSRAESGLRASESPQRGTRVKTPSPSESRVPRASATYDDGSQDAARAAGWKIIQPGTPAARYWQRHGVGTADDDTSGLSACEAALRVQFVRGYLGTTTDGKTALWQAECGAVSDAERDSMLQAAIQWGSDHPEGDG